MHLFSVVYIEFYQKNQIHFAFVAKEYLDILCSDSRELKSALSVRCEY